MKILLFIRINGPHLGHSSKLVRFNVILIELYLLLQYNLKVASYLFEKKNNNQMINELVFSNSRF